MVTTQKKQKQPDQLTTSTLSVAESTEFSNMERQIEGGLETFRVVGNALLTIRDKRLYRQQYKTFEAYLNQRWQLDRVRGYQLMDAAKTVNQLALDLELQSPATDLVSPTQMENDQDETLLAIPTGKTKRLVSTNLLANQRPVDVSFIETQSEDSGEPIEEGNSLLEGNLQTIIQQTKSPDLMEEVEELDQNKTQIDQDSLTDVLADGDEIPLHRLPSRESHALVLSDMPADKRAEVWKQVVKESEQTNTPITARTIKNTAQQVGVPLNKRPRSDKKKNDKKKSRLDPDEEFSDDQVELTRAAMKEPGRETLVRTLQNATIDQAYLVVTGPFLLDQQLDQIWMKMRSLTDPITTNFTDKISLAEAVGLKLIGRIC